LPPTSPPAKHATTVIELSRSFLALRLCTLPVSAVSPWGNRHLRRLDCKPEHWWRPQPQLSVARARLDINLGIKASPMLALSFCTRCMLRQGEWGLLPGWIAHRRGLRRERRGAPPWVAIGGADAPVAVDLLTDGCD
jgi:hypothetical protein